jgi:recombination associated protein RdgC
MDFLDILREKAFLGREFLTWLWFKSDQTGGRIEIPGKKVAEVLFLDRMTLDLSDVETPQTVTLKGEHSELREGLAALKEGKKIEEARISIRAGDNDFTMMLKGTWFSFGSFKTPPILPPGEAEGEADTEGSFLEKTYLIEEGMEIVDNLFEYFLKLRISEEWEAQELPAIHRWVSTASQ